MVFSGLPFLFFFLPIIFIFYFINKNIKYRNIILLIFSLIFYAWGEPIYIILMIFSSIVDYINGRLIEKYNDKKLKKLFLILSIIINVSLLGFFKYSSFFITIINNALGIDIPLLDISLPIGISFYTFQTMSYSIDVYMKRVKAEHNFLDFITYVSMFPQLIAGPIVRYEDVKKELKKREITFNSFSDGMMRFLRGLFKKVILANGIGLLYSTVITSDLTTMSLLTSWLGLIAFSFQIFYDFSGYSDMAIGMGKMFGFNYPENFNFPYISKSITEFWRRWHMSLSTWFRDYLYIPLGGSRCSIKRNIFNILLVWTLTGLWHGASYNFILWGLYFGLLLVIEKFILKKTLEKMPNPLKHIYSIILILFGWLIFMCDNIKMLPTYFLNLFNINNIIDKTSLYYLKNYSFIFIICIIFSIPVFKTINNKLKKYKFIKFILGITYIILLIISISYIVNQSYNPFLYFRF